MESISMFALLSNLTETRETTLTFGASAPYRSSRNEAWLKIKTIQKENSPSSVS
jgi:hypothetical protein